MRGTEFKEFKKSVTQEIATLKQNQAKLLEIKNTTEQIKNSVQSLNNRMKEAGERISKLKDISCHHRVTNKKMEKQLD